MSNGSIGRTGEGERRRLTAPSSGLLEGLGGLLDSVHVGIVIQSEDGRIRYANPMASQILDLDREALCGRSSEDPAWQMIREDGELVPGSEHPAMVALRTGEPVRDAVRGIYAEDPARARWLRIHSEPFGEDPGGRPTGVLSTFSDITEERRAVAERDSSEDRYRHLFEAGSDAIFLIEAGTGRILDANRAASALYGYTHEELCALHNYDLSHQPKETQRAVAEKRALVALRWHRKRDGSVFPVEITGSYFPWRGRDVHVASIRDITERLRLEEELGAIFEMSSDLICIADLATSTFLKVNRASERLLGWTQAELMARPFLELVHPEDVPATRAVITDRLARGEMVLRFVNRYRHKDGGYRWLDWAAQPVAERGITFAIGRDITEAREAELHRERLEAQLRQAIKMEAIGRLAGGVAHDFNNLLTGIVGNLSFARICGPGDPLIGESIEAAQDAAHRATELTRQLLSFSRRQILRPTVVDLGDALRGILRLLPRIIGEDVKVAFVAHPESLPLRVDPGQLEQVVMNLAVNARDAMPGGGGITFETFASSGGASGGERVGLRVTDTGSGIPAEHLDKVFEPFFTTKELGRGTGLGLSTVFGIVTQHGGDIEVRSTPGEGATFVITFPRAGVAPEAATPRESAPESTRGTERILLVEDEAAVRKIAGRALSREGYEVLEAEDGPAALALLDELPEPPALLLTDIVMPGMNGQELAVRVRARLPGIRVLYSSGYSEEVIAHHGVLDEGVELLQKPYDGPTLLRTVRRVLDR